MQKWDNKSDLWLLTPDEFEQMPDGTKLTSIDGIDHTVGPDTIDGDLRRGYLAYGIMNPFDHKLKDLFLTFVLSE